MLKTLNLLLRKNKMIFLKKKKKNSSLTVKEWEKMKTYSKDN